MIDSGRLFWINNFVTFLVDGFMFMVIAVAVVNDIRYLDAFGLKKVNYIIFNSIFQFN